MSIDLDVVPLRPGPPTWGALRLQWANRIGEGALSLLGPEPQLRHLDGEADEFVRGTLLRALQRLEET